jgi:hypothetical protein
LVDSPQEWPVPTALLIIIEPTYHTQGCPKNPGSVAQTIF